MWKNVSLWKNICTNTINPVATIPNANCPEPIAIPTPAVPHIPAAVVRPDTALLFLTNINPAINQSLIQFCDATRNTCNFVNH